MARLPKQHPIPDDAAWASHQHQMHCWLAADCLWKALVLDLQAHHSTVPPPTKARQCGTSLLRLGCLQLNTMQPFLQVCCSSCHKSMAGISSNKYHLCPNQHQSNWQPCCTCTCARTGPMQTAYVRPDEVCLASPLEWQPSIVAQTKTCQNGGPVQTPCGAKQVQSKATDPRVQWRIPGLTSSAQHLSPVALFTSAKEKLTTR